MTGTIRMTTVNEKTATTQNEVKVCPGYRGTISTKTPEKANVDFHNCSSSLGAIPKQGKTSTCSINVQTTVWKYIKIMGAHCF